MCLLFQRQDEPVEVIWAGRAGHYVDDALYLHALKFPPRAPTTADYADVPHSHTARSTRVGRRVQREQRVARGLCVDCPNATDGDAIRCRMCLDRNAAKQAARTDSRDQRLGRCSRCARRPRARQCGLWCRLCWNSAHRAEGAA